MPRYARCFSFSSALRVLENRHCLLLLQLDRTLRGLDSAIIVEQAQALRPGHTCTFELPLDYVAIKKAKGPKNYSGMNIHFPLDFDDGIKWMVRARFAKVYCPPPDLQRMVTESEVTTMRFLKENNILVPDAWLPPVVNSKTDSNLSPDSKLSYELLQDSPLISCLLVGNGTDYFFEEFIDGQSWMGETTPLTEDTIADDIARTFITDMARHHQLLSSIPLKVQGIGSLWPNEAQSDPPQLGPLIQGSFLMTPDPPYFLGPFKTNKERYLTKIDLAMDYIRQGCSLRADPVGYLLAHLEMRDLVEGNEEMGREETEFFIKHADDKNDQYMLTEDGHIVGVLDWEW